MAKAEIKFGEMGGGGLSPTKKFNAIVAKSNGTQSCVISADKRYIITNALCRQVGYDPYSGVAYFENGQVTTIDSGSGYTEVTYSSGNTTITVTNKNTNYDSCLTIVQLD